jgi:hypothetical protein
MPETVAAMQGRGRGWPSKRSRARARYFNRGRGQRGDPCIARQAILFAAKLGQLEYYYNFRESEETEQRTGW